MKLLNTGDPQNQPPIVMLCYGEGGVGKTTFASTAPNPIIADCEYGSKYFGLRGINVDTAIIENWEDTKEFWATAKKGDYETVVVDPIGELMEKLKASMAASGDTKLVQKDGNPTMAGWGWLKEKMRRFIKALRDSGKHVVIIAHLSEKQDEDRMVKRPDVQTKLADDLVNIVDIVGYMTTSHDPETGEDKRYILVDPTSDKMVAKDRTGQLGKFIPPDFSKIIDGLHGNKEFSWLKDEKESPKKKQSASKKKKTTKSSSKAKKTSQKATRKQSGADEEADTSDLDPFGTRESKKGNDDAEDQLEKAQNK